MSPFLPFEAKFKKAGFKVIAGMDEVGRGPLAGPVVSAAVILKERCRLPGLKDSKLLSRKQRENLYERIIANCLDYSISLVSHLVIDDVNILNALRLANANCLDYLKIKPDLVLVDGKDKQIFKTPFISIIKGDRYVKSIAAASVLAKVARDHVMYAYSKEFKNYNFEKHVGYGTSQHYSLLRKYGACEIHRKSYNLGII